MKYQMVFVIIGAINLNKYLYISDVLIGILILDVHLYLSNLAFIKLMLLAHFVMANMILCALSIILKFFKHRILESKTIFLSSGICVPAHVGVNSIKSWWGRNFPHPSRSVRGPNQPPIRGVLGIYQG